MAPAPGGIARRCKREPAWREAAVEQLDEQLAERHALRAQRVQRDVTKDLEARRERAHREHGSRAGEEALDADRRAVVLLECERVVVAEPARQGLRRRREVLRCAVEERRRTRPAVEVLVAATDCEICTARADVAAECTGAVGEIPDGERARRVGGLRDCREVVDLRAAVADVAQRDGDGELVDRSCDLVDRQQHELEAALLGNAARDVDVGRKVVGVGDQPRAPLAQSGGAVEGLEEVDRRRVTGDHGAGLRTDQRRDRVAGPASEADPVRRSPRPDQAGSPLLRDDPCERLARRLWQSSKRVPVEVDDPIGKREELAQVRERIGAIEGGGVSHRPSGAACDRRARCPGSRGRGSRRSGCVPRSRARRPARRARAEPRRSLSSGS